MVSDEKMFENVDGRTDAGVTGILFAHPLAFSSGELINNYGRVLPACILQFNSSSKTKRLCIYCKAYFN